MSSPCPRPAAARRLAAVLAAAALTGGALPAGAAELWSRAFDHTGQDLVWALAELPDGTLLAAGHTGPPEDKGRVWLAALDPAGNLLRESGLAPVSPAFAGGADHVTLLGDGGAIVTGRDVYDLFLRHHAWVARLDPAWNVTWVTRFLTPPDPDGIGRWLLADAVATAAGGVAAAGTTGESDAGPFFAWLVELDATGAPRWQVRYGDGAPAPRALAALSGGGFVLAGSATPASGPADGWVLGVGADGTPLWQLTLGGPDQDELVAVVEVGDGGLALAGWTASFTASGRAAWAVRLDRAGALVWQQVLGDGEWSDFAGVEVTAGGNLLFTGRLAEPGAQSNDLWLVELDASDGAVVWQRAWDSGLGDWGETSLALGDGTLLAGGSLGWGFAEEAPWLLRLDPGGNLPGCRLGRDTTVAAASPPVAVATTPATSSPGGAATATLGLSPVALARQATTHCQASACPYQGNVLFGVRSQGDVLLAFPAAPASEWRLYRDVTKLEIGRTELTPDVATPSFTDPGAVALGDDFYYDLRGLCGGVPGP